MAFQLYTQEKAVRKPQESKPRGHLGKAGNLHLTIGAVQAMGLEKGARTEVLVDREACRLALRVGGSEMNGSSRAIVVNKNGASVSVLSALKGFGLIAPDQGVHLVPLYENGMWVFDLPRSMKAKAP